MFLAFNINLQISLDVINEKLILYVVIIRQVFKMSLTSIEFVSSLETSRFLFSSRDLVKRFLRCCKSLSKGLL
jgi:hypothetical protein